MDEKCRLFEVNLLIKNVDWFSGETIQVVALIINYSCVPLFSPPVTSACLQCAFGHI